jgi:hypothetical protein
MHTAIIRYSFYIFLLDDGIVHKLKHVAQQEQHKKSAVSGGCSCYTCVSLSKRDVPLKKKNRTTPIFIFSSRTFYFMQVVRIKKWNSQRSIGNIFFWHEHVYPRTFLLMASNQGPLEQHVTQSHSIQGQIINEHNRQIPSLCPSLYLLHQLLFILNEEQTRKAMYT